MILYVSKDSGFAIERPQKNLYLNSTGSDFLILYRNGLQKANKPCKKLPDVFYFPIALLHV